MLPSRESGDTDRAREDAAVAALRSASAVSPDRAVRLREAGLEPSEALGVLIVRGVVREGRPGTFYVFEGAAPGAAREPAPHDGLTPARTRRWLLALVVLLVLLLGPLLFLQLAGPSAPLPR